MLVRYAADNTPSRSPEARPAIRQPSQLAIVNTYLLERPGFPIKVVLFPPKSRFGSIFAFSRGVTQ
jgi:hypothetical protein